MKKNIVLFCLLGLSMFSVAQDTIRLNVVYEFSYTRDLDNPQNPYKTNMVLSVGKNSSRYCSEKLFNDNDKRAIEARKQEQQRMENTPSSSMIVVTGAPLLVVNKYGTVINEELNKQFAQKKLLIDAKIGLRVYHAESDLPEIKWSVLPARKKIGNYDCQKASASYGGRTYEAWFTTQIPYPDGPWKLYGLPGLILEARDTANEISFVFKEISKNEDNEETTRSFLNSQYSIKTNVSNLNKARKAFETDPEGVMSAQAPNASLVIKNMDNPNDKRVLKIKNYNPMEL